MSLEKLRLTKMSTVTVDRILVARKAYDQQECQLGQLTGFM